MVVGYTLLNTWKQIICVNMHTISLTFFLPNKMACVFFFRVENVTYFKFHATLEMNGINRNNISFKFS